MVNHIEIPQEFIELASNWYEGSGSMLYAITSTNSLTIGTQRPFNDDDLPMSDEEWYVHLWHQLDIELMHLVKRLKPGTRDRGKLRKFQKFAEKTANQLMKEYGF